MPTEKMSVDDVWECMAKVFDPATVNHYRDMSRTDRDKAAREAKSTFREEVADLSTSTHDINLDGAKQRLILGHLILAILDGIHRGVKEWRPFPHLQNLTWSQKETALLLWAAQHGTSDETSIRAN